MCNIHRTKLHIHRNANGHSLGGNGCWEMLLVFVHFVGSLAGT